VAFDGPKNPAELAREAISMFLKVFSIMAMKRGHAVPRNDSSKVCLSNRANKPIAAGILKICLIRTVRNPPVASKENSRSDPTVQDVGRPFIVGYTSARNRATYPSWGAITS